jgi:hypothetical protein
MHFDVITWSLGALAALPLAFGLLQLTACGGRYGRKLDF